ncbi:hypothetical protein LV779_10770 [Streptomyces thinghirensis]|nr:hypothetical protein [Streptomyces thinghirensis]
MKHDLIVSAVPATARGEVGVVTSAGRLLRVNVVDLPQLPEPMPTPNLPGWCAAGGVRDPGGRRDGRLPDHPGRVLARPGARYGTGCRQARGARLPVQQGRVGGHRPQGGRPDRRRRRAAHRRRGPGLHHGRPRSCCATRPRRSARRAVRRAV